MNILVFTTSTNNTNTFYGSLECLGEHNVSVFAYDRRWHEEAVRAIQQNPSFQEQLQTGQARIPRDRCSMDEAMLKEAQLSKPDAIVYISAWQGDFIPLNETLGELNQIAPLIHFLSDGEDPPWVPQLMEFDRRGCFSLTVNIDGGHDWPGGKDWPDEKLKGKCLTLLTPIDLRYFRQTGLAYGERPYGVVYSGSPSSPVRSAVVNRLNRIVGFHYRQRDNNPNSYHEHIGFLTYSRVSVNVPFSGSGVARQVKGRVLETAFAGAALLEWQNHTMRSWFVPRYEFEEYSSVEECQDMAEFLLHHPKRSEDIAKALNYRILNEHHPKIFWDKVLGAVT